jgi:hypothetical protein
MRAGIGIIRKAALKRNEKDQQANLMKKKEEV